MAKINIDGKEYETENLSKEAKDQLAALRATDAEIQRLKLRLAIAQTARNTYANALKDLLDA